MLAIPNRIAVLLRAPYDGADRLGLSGLREAWVTAVGVRITVWEGVFYGGAAWDEDAWVGLRGGLGIA
ncbi:hypothetical protein BOMU111920_24285 [Bordetella muralis]